MDGSSVKHTCAYVKVEKGDRAGVECPLIEATKEQFEFRTADSCDGPPPRSPLSLLGLMAPRGHRFPHVQDKYKGRVQMPNVTSLEIRNLTPQDSGRYMAYVLSTSTDFVYQVFHLKVYEPVSPPQIVAEALSVTAGWCNVTLECRPTGPTEDLNVTWESKGLPRELEQTWTPGPAPNPWTQAVSLPLSQASGSLTCVVSNPVDQNRATSDLRDICPPGTAGVTVAADVLSIGEQHPEAQGALSSVYNPQKGEALRESFREVSSHLSMERRDAEPTPVTLKREVLLNQAGTERGCQCEGSGFSADGLMEGCELPLLASMIPATAFSTKNQCSDPPSSALDI
ncbi:SLAM family member 9 [Fukomys damarensis]|uniref:SLAM family member 9 n=1 Tax=Fukomys damarensis TaxID=885580 RepID=A0A091D1K9_FUKDA|nr:SLAM family member 9 [Fukomys damarensis]